MFLPFSPLVCSLIIMRHGSLHHRVGFYGVSSPDIFSVCIWIGVILIVISRCPGSPGSGDLGALAASVTGNPDWLSALSSVENPDAERLRAYSFLFMMTLFYLGDRYPGTGSGGDPQVLRARLDRDCGRLSFLAAGVSCSGWPLMMQLCRARA